MAQLSDAALNQGFARRANQGAEEEEFRANLVAGRDPFAPMGPGNNSAFHALVHGVQSWCLPLAIELATRPAMPGQSIPQPSSARDLVVRMTRSAEPAEAIREVHRSLLAKGAGLEPLEDIARAQVKVLLGQALRGPRAEDFMVVSALRFVSLSAQDLQDLWPHQSKASGHLRALMDALPQDQRPRAIRRGLQSSSGWAIRALVAMAPTAGAGELLDYLKGWAGEKGTRILSESAPQVLDAAIRSAPRHAFAWIKKCAPRNLDEPWRQVAQQAGTSPWRLLLSKNNMSSATERKLISRIRTAQAWVRRPVMGWEGAWEAWLRLATFLDKQGSDLILREELLKDTRKLGEALVSAGALECVCLQSFPEKGFREPALGQVLEPARSLVLQGQMEEALSSVPASQPAQPRPGRI